VSGEAAQAPPPWTAFQESLRTYLKPGYPILYVVTAEEERAIELIAAAQALDFRTHGAGKGTRAAHAAAQLFQACFVVNWPALEQPCNQIGRGCAEGTWWTRRFQRESQPTSTASVKPCRYSTVQAAGSVSIARRTSAEGYLAAVSSAPRSPPSVLGADIQTRTPPVSPGSARS